jgi:signal transduction histidine kinase
MWQHMNFEPTYNQLGLSELLRSNKGRGNSSSNSNSGSNSAVISLEKEEELLDVIVRNSKRLRLLAEDILDVAKIEGSSLFLKEREVQYQRNDNRDLK